MFFKFQNIITYLRNIFTAYASTIPTISVQPRLYIPKFTPTQEKQDMVTGVTSILGENPFNHISIAFIVDYHITATNTYEKINQEFDLKNTFFCLERFRMKRFINEPYKRDLHKPRTIMSSIGNQYGDTPLNDLNNIAQRDEGGCKYECQLIQLIHKDEIKNVTDLKKSVNEFKRIFVKYINPLELQSYAFRFVVFIKLKGVSSTDILHIEVNTELFVLNFSNDGCGITLTYASASNYHVI